jgi:lipoprotein-anchoring transpeptidase ErfK/SrfK
MCKSLRRMMAILLALVLVLGIYIPAGAAFEDFPDAQNHWARETLKKACDYGFLEGFEDGTLRPNTPITTAQMITILCRVLNASETADISGLGIPEDAWYAEAAAKALHLGLIDQQTGDLNASMSRKNAFLMMAKAFQLSKANPDLTQAKQYVDFNTLSGQEARIIGSLVDDGYIEGYNGSLTLSSSITRAEFMTVLFRVADTTYNANTLPDSSDENIILTGSAQLYDHKLTGNLWTDCSTSTVRLSRFSANTFTIRSNSLSRLSLTSVELSRLVLANLKGSVTVAPTASTIGTIVVGDGAGSVSVRGSTKNIEITGSGRTVSAANQLDTLYIVGDNNTVTVRGNTTRLVINGSGNTIILSGNVTEATVDGENNTVSISSGRQVEALTADGENNRIQGTGRVETLTVKSKTAVIDVSYGTYIDKIDTGISEVVISLTGNSPLPAGETLKINANFSNPAVGKTCKATWYLDGKEMSTTDLTFDEAGTQLTFTHKYTYSRDMALTSTARLVLSYTTEDGEYQEVSSTFNITLENYDDAYYDKYDEQAVLKLVTTGYRGNWTTQWAIDNDYEARQKEIWVNAKGYYSNTNYLVWISIATQHVNIFQGSTGNWKLIRSALCGTGALSTPTPVTPNGAYWQITYKNAAGWTTSTYTCKPVVGFYQGGYAFHSRLYYPNSSTLMDPSIGYPISHGCIRMYDPDIQYIYDNIPVGTRVVVY